MLMSRRIAWSLFAVLLLLLLIGTQMPGFWRQSIERSLHAPLSLSSWAHFVVFAGMALVLAMRPLSWPAGRVLLLALVLAILTEGLQFFALDRHPRLRDVGIDMAGTGLGLILAWRASTLSARSAARNTGS